MLLTGKVALVTGAASGIGEACAVAIAAAGAAVVIADIDEVNGERVAEVIREAGGSSSFRRTDVTSADEVAELVAHTVVTFGGLHLAVNNAGIGCMPARFHEISLEEWDRMLALDLRGVMLCMRSELAHFVGHGGGAIVNMASGAGLRAAAGMAPYVASKHAVIGMTRTAAVDYATAGIRVNAVAPGPIGTPAMRSFPLEQQELWASPVPLKRLGEPSEVASTVVFLLSDLASYTTGSVFEVDGGFMQSSA